MDKIGIMQAEMFSVFCNHHQHMFISLLYHKWRSMFYVVIVLILGQAFFMYKGVQSMPFFLFFMYAGKTHASDTSSKTTIYVNDKMFTARMVNREAETLLASLGFYKGLKKNNLFAVQPATIEKRFRGRIPDNLYNVFFERLTNTNINDSMFYNWWGKYLSQVTGEKVDSFSIITSTVIWKPVYTELNDTIELIHHVVKE